MTLMEVLAAVFILGMGLIMVAGAFPVGMLQTRLTKEQTDTSVLARSAVSLVEEERYLRHLSLSDSKKSNTLVRGRNNEEWRIWNPTRLAYLENWHDSKMWPAGGGDYVWLPFLTRLSAEDEVPLYRLTIVVIRYTNAAPEFTTVHPQTGYIEPRKFKLTPLGRNTRLRSVSSGNLDDELRPGDYLMDTRTGYCSRIGTVEAKQLTLSAEPAIPLSGTADYYGISGVVGIYYTLLSD
jgi:hypothetical protein